MIWPLLFACLLTGPQSSGDEEEVTTLQPLGALSEPYCEMTELGRIALPGDYKTAVEVQDDYAYVTTGWAGLFVVDISNPATPVVVGSYEDFDDYDALRLQVRGDQMAVAHLWSGWYLLDISDPTQPRQLSRTVVEHPNPEATWGLPVTDVWMDDQYAYVAGTHLLIYDISDPSTPELLGEVPPEWDESVEDPFRLHTTTTVVVDGDYAYLTEADDVYGRIVVVDIRDKRQPRVVAWVDGPGDVYQLDLVGHIIFAADLEFGMRAIDISDPLAPVALDTFRTSGQSYSLQADGDRVYVADNLNGLMGIDISDPTELQWASFHYVGGTPGRVGLEIGDGDGPWGVSAHDGILAMISTDDLVMLKDCGR